MALYNYSGFVALRLSL